MLSESSSVKGSPEDKQPSGPCIKGSAKISRRVTLALYTVSISVKGAFYGILRTTLDVKASQGYNRIRNLSFFLR